MVNDLLVAYGIYRVGSVLFWPLLLIGFFLVFTPIGWLILAVMWFLRHAYKGIEEQVAEEDAKARQAELEAPPATS